MQKLIGSILVLTATAGAGYLYGEGLKDYLRQMEYLRYIAGMIRGQLEYTGAPLQELLMDVSAKIKEPYKSWLEHTARRTAKRTDADFTEIWKGCVEKDLGAAGSTETDRKYMEAPTIRPGSVLQDWSEMPVHLSRCALRPGSGSTQGFPLPLS